MYIFVNDATIQESANIFHTEYVLECKVTRYVTNIHIRDFVWMFLLYVHAFRYFEATIESTH